MNKDQLFGIEHKQAMVRERNFPIDLNSKLNDNNIEWICSSTQLADTLPSTTSRNKHLWSFTVMDVIFLFNKNNDNQLNVLSTWLQETNNTLTIISDNFDSKTASYVTVINDYIKIIIIPELLGLPYHDYQYKDTYNHNKLFNAFMQRIQEDRLHLFVELAKRSLLNNGNVSFLSILSLGNEHDPVSKRQEYVNELLHNVPNSIPVSVPYKNFVEPIKNFTALEEECKYSVVYETYNKQYNRVIITEKTIRTLQVPNISIIANTNGSYRILKDLGFELHDLNAELDSINSWNAQAKWICDALEKDEYYFDFNYQLKIAKHNTAILKDYSQYIETPQFVNRVRDYILM